MLAGTPEVSPRQFSNWAAAAFRTASSPEPPLMAPVRRSETKGHSPTTQGWPGRSRLTVHSPARHSARPCASAPARAAGEVAPACPAEMSRTGMPEATCATRHSLDSSANRSGGTTKVL